MYRGVGLDRTAVLQIALYQGLIAGSIALLLALISPLDAWSSVLGGLVCMLSNMITGLYWSRRGMRHQQVTQDLIVGEGGKWAGTIIMFVCVFVFYEDLQPVPFFATFLALFPLPLVVGWRQTKNVAGRH